MPENRPKHISAGSVLLKAKLAERKATADLERELGKSRGLVSRWATGARKPTPDDRAVLQEKFGIDWRAWDRPPSEAEASGGAAPPFPSIATAAVGDSSAA